MWSVPLIAAVAVIGALAAIGTLGLGGASADELPNSPQNLKVKAADGNSGRTNLVLTWEASASGAPDMYRIDVSIKGDKWSPEAEVSSSTLTYTDDLTSAVDAEIDKTPEAPVSVTRYYRVFADNSHGSGQVSTTESASTKDVSAPAAVDAFGARALGPEEIELTWTVPDDGGSEILGYCIQAWSVEAGHVDIVKENVSEDNCKNLLFSSGPGNNDENTPLTPAAETDGFVIRATPGSSHTHKNLRAGQTWNYTAYALNKYGHSMTASNTRQVKTASANNPPSPGNLLIRQVADADVQGSIDGVVVQLYWTVTGDGGQEITAYRVEVTDTPEGWAPDDTPLGNATGAGRASSAILSYPIAVPAVTTGKQFAVINVSPGGGDSEMVSYNLRHTVAMEAGAIPARLYYRVRVETGMGNSAKMSSYTRGLINVTVSDADATPPVVPVHNAKTPNAPELVDDPVVGVDDDTVPGEIKLTVTRSTMGGTSDYRVDISDDGGETWTMVHRSTRPINETEYQHQGLEPNKERSFRIFTKNGSNFGLASDVVTDTSGQSKAPDRVENLMAAKNGAGEVKVSWTAPLKDNGAMVDKYCVVMNQIGDDNVVIGATPAAREIAGQVGIFVSGMNANCTRYGLPDLYPGKASINGSNRIIAVDADLTMITAKVGQETRWQFEVYALNGATEVVVPPEQNGLATTSEKVHDKTTAGMTPNMPRDLTAELARDTNLSGSGNRGVLLLWNQPAGVPGAPVSSYKIERSKDGGDYEVLVSSHNASRTYYVDTSEPATDEARAYRVTAINIAGAGTQMATVMIPYPPTHTTHTTPPAVDALTAPSITAATAGTGTITVEWTPGENADGHLAMLFTDDFVGDPVVATKTATDTMHTFPNVANDGYVVVVVSYTNSFDFQFVFTPVSVPAN